MGQFLDYLASVFTTSKVEGSNNNNNMNMNKTNYVTFSDNSFANVFGSNSHKSDALLASLTSTNKRTLYLYQLIGGISFFLHLFMVTMPKVQTETFDLYEPEGYQLITLSLLPLVVYLASISAMNLINRPLSEGVKLSAKNSTGLDLNNNDFTYTLKVVILLMAICQVASLFNEQFIWCCVMIVSLWCYQLTSKVAQAEYQRYTPSPKKQWVNLNISKSPKVASPNKTVKQTPSKQQKAQQDNGQVPATPRTRTRRAVKNIINGVSDKYHAFEQNVAHQLSQKIFNPMSPKVKMIE